MLHLRSLVLLLPPVFCIVGISHAEDKAPSSDKLGTKIANVAFKGADGKSTNLHDIKDNKAVAVVFLNFECPNSNGYAPTLNQMVKNFGDKVAFVGICNCEEDADHVAKMAKEFKLEFPVYRDEKGAAVEAFKAAVTPEAFVLDHNFVLRYRGRIDDGYSARLKKNLVITSNDLRKALEEHLAGKPISTPVTAAVGCPIFAEKDVKADGKVTYYRDVLPIVQNACQSCHRPGEVGPFSLMTYKQAVNWAKDMKDYTQSHQMPPWKITDGIAFQNDRKLSDKDIATIAAWVDGGTPAGDPKDAPKPKKFADGWMRGKPDLVLTTDEFVLGPGGRDLFRCFVMPTGLTEDKFVVAYEVRPGNPRVVHHTLNFIDTTGRGRKLEETAQEQEKKDKKEGEFDRGPGYSQSMGIGFLPTGAIGGWAPGQLPHVLPEGYGFPLAKNSDMVVQVHYHRDGRVEKDKLQIGLYFAKKNEGMKPFKGGVIAGLIISIPANNDHFKVTGTSEASEDCTLHSIMPHMHLIGRSIKVTMKEPDANSPITLLDIKDWDYNWQETYFLKEPMKIKKGTTFTVEAVYDNSDKNPNNPNNPPKPVTFGEQTTNEMCFIFFGATSDGSSRAPIRPNGIGRLRPRPEENK
jgi:thiol-disulfide isomerase/thioredoxin